LQVAQLLAKPGDLVGQVVDERQRRLLEPHQLIERRAADEFRQQEGINPERT